MLFSGSFVYVYLRCFVFSVNYEQPDVNSDVLISRKEYQLDYPKIPFSCKIGTRFRGSLLEDAALSDRKRLKRCGGFVRQTVESSYIGEGLARPLQGDFVPISEFVVVFYPISPSKELHLSEHRITQPRSC